MALPVRPSSGLPVPAPTEESLPEIPETRASEPSSDRTPPRSAERTEEGFSIDPKTGKKYKELPGFKPGVLENKAAVKIAKTVGMTLTQLRATTEMDPDFNLDDLNGSANLFLPHLRVPPNKEEQMRLREEKAKRQQAYNSAFERSSGEEESSED